LDCDPSVEDILLATEGGNHSYHSTKADKPPGPREAAGEVKIHPEGTGELKKGELKKGELVLVGTTTSSSFFF